MTRRKKSYHAQNMDANGLKGIITDIHRASVVDGPGIRTTVFLKGCPLSCLWCHNPETQAPDIELAVNQEKCVGCGDCVVVCPHNALGLEGDRIVLNRDRCVSCFNCVEVCPTGALFTYGRPVTVDDILREVLKDRLYYQESGGGVTISGGEPMSQAAFTIALLKACKKAGIHTCLDTTGIGSEDAFRKTLPWTDCYLFDYKASDPDLHQRLAGSPLPAVLRTFDLLVENNARIRLRCPLIPGVNDDEDHLKRIAEISRSKPALDGVDLLCWHTMGTGKYTFLGRAASEQLPVENTSDKQKATYREFMEGEHAKGITIL